MKNLGTHFSKKTNGRSVVTLNNVAKYLEGRLILDDISFSVEPGEFLILLGPSGCGKTTVLNLISGLEEPDSGEILINHTSVKGLGPQARNVNTVFQNYALFPHLTVFDNVAFGLRCEGLPEAEIKIRTLDALKMVKLETLADRRPDKLSGGQKQRVAIARAAVKRPDVLLLDEPLSSLDYRLRKKMQLELKQLQTQLGVAFIFVTHDQEEALSIADRVIVMDEGKIIQIGTPREVYEEPHNLKVAKFIGEVNIFETTVIQANLEYIKFLVEGHEITLQNPRQFSVNQSLSILIRPEDLRVSKYKEEDNKPMFEGHVEQVIYKGSTVDLVIRLTNQRLLSATQFFNEDDDELDFQLGTSVWVSWIPGWEVVLPNET